MLQKLNLIYYIPYTLSFQLSRTGGEEERTMELKLIIKCFFHNFHNQERPEQQSSWHFDSIMVEKGLPKHMITLA